MPAAVPDLYAGLAIAGQQSVGARLHLLIGFAVSQAGRRDVIGSV